MVAKFSSLAAKSDDLVCEGGVSYADLSALLATQFSDSTERSQTIQRIASKAASQKREEESAAAAATADDA